MQIPMSSFLCKSSGDPNSGPPAYRTGSLLTKSFPEPYFYFQVFLLFVYLYVSVCVLVGSGYGFIEAKVNLELINSANLAGQGALEST